MASLWARTLRRSRGRTFFRGFVHVAASRSDRSSGKGCLRDQDRRSGVCGWLLQVMALQTGWLRDHSTSDQHGKTTSEVAAVLGHRRADVSTPFAGKPLCDAPVGKKGMSSGVEYERIVPAACRALPFGRSARRCGATRPVGYGQPRFPDSRANARAIWTVYRHAHLC